MKRYLVFLYGSISYLIFLAVFLYAIGFLADWLVPKSINSGTHGLFGQSLLINALLLSLFAIQHTIMARPGFKKVLTRIIPKAAERSTFVLLSSLILALIFWQWRPFEGQFWLVKNQAGVMLLHALSAVGWLMVLVSTFIIDHFELFGLKQIWYYLKGEEMPPTRFKESFLYKYVRHPIMLGFIIAFWATPNMSYNHFMFAFLTTGYILIGLLFEEADLRYFLGSVYDDYRRRVPMLIPFSKRRKDDELPKISEEERYIKKN